MKKPAKTYIEKMEARFALWSVKFEEMAARVEDTEVGEFRAHIDELKSRQAEARKKLEELKAAGDADWERFRIDLWITWNELENEFGDFQDYFSRRKKNEGNEKQG